MPLPLVALFLAAFAYGTTEFVIAGVLPDVANAFDISVPTAGWLVSGYALGIAVGGPLLTIATAHLPRRTLLIALTIAFTIGQVACALAPGFTSMLAIRVAVAFAHGAYFGVAMVVAVGLVAPEKRGMAVALVLAGLTVSGIVGVPLGTAIGQAFGWRATFWAMCLLGIISLAAMVALMPVRIGGATPSPGFGREVRVLGRQQVWTCLIIMLMLMLAQFVPYTYITPFLIEGAGIRADFVPFVLLLNGVGATIGVFVGGRLAGWKLMPSLIVLVFLQAVVMTAMYHAGSYPWAMVAIVTLWGAVNFAIGTPIQTRILTWTADAPNLASSLIPAGFNVGIALAAFVGGMMLNAGYSYSRLPIVGVLSMLVATLVALASYADERLRRLTPPQPGEAYPKSPAVSADSTA